MDKKVERNSFITIVFIIIVMLLPGLAYSNLKNESKLKAMESLLYSKEEPVYITAEADGIVKKIFVKKDASIEADKIIGLITPIEANNYETSYLLIRTNELRGKIVNVLVKEGDKVKKGQKLFALQIES